jgi:hypothetical protein
VKNKLTDLRNHLFETLEALKDKNDPMELERARVIGEVARTVIDTARVEVQYRKWIDMETPQSDFFDTPKIVEGETQKKLESVSAEGKDGR